jgi:hypothetical protein
MDSLTDRISSGDVKVKGIRTQCPVILKKDEEVLCSIPNIYLYEPRAIRVNTGVRVRVPLIKGVSVYKGQGESHPEMRNTDKGTLIVTNKRFIYYATFKNITIDLKKIVQIDPCAMAICVYKEGREKSYYFTTISPEAGKGSATPKGFIKSLSVFFGMESKEQLEERLKERLKELGIDKFGYVEIVDNGKQMSIPLTGEVMKSIIQGSVRSE